MPISWISARDSGEGRGPIRGEEGLSRRAQTQRRQDETEAERKHKRLGLRRTGTEVALGVSVAQSPLVGRVGRKYGMMTLAWTTFAACGPGVRVGQQLIFPSSTENKKGKGGLRLFRSLLYPRVQLGRNQWKLSFGKMSEENNPRALPCPLAWPFASFSPVPTLQNPRVLGT